jgi:diguanylate cyclase (GGDEF)-like protein/PAS domain S-box-containing protein
MSEYADIIINATPPPLITLDKNLRIVTANDSFYTFFHVKSENAIGYLIYELDNKQWDIPALRELLEIILPQKTSFNSYLVEHNFANIGRRIMLMNAQQIEEDEDRELIILLSMEDVTERVDELVTANEEKDKLEDDLVIANKEKDKLEDDLVIANKEKDKLEDDLVIANEEKDKRADELVIANEEKEHLLQKIRRAASVFTHTQESIMITDATATITEVNDTFSRITGYDSKDVLGENSRILQSGCESPEFFREMWDTLQTQGHWRGEISNRRKNGQIFPAMLSISAVKNADGLTQHYVSLSTDISSIKAYQRQLERSTHYDLLTNLPNRVLVTDRITQALVQCQRGSQSLAVAFMDLDGFKDVNDKYGHNMGDELLIAVSQQMQAALHEDDTLARIGGDEFIAVMINLEKPEDSLPVLECLIKAAANPVTVGDVIMQVSVSMGVAFYPQDGVEADPLIRRADQAMYVAKQEGKNRYHLFDTAKDNLINTQRKSINDVRTAMASDEFVLHYQPKVNMQTGDVIGVEALIRWQHSVRGLVPPLDFLPVIEGHAISLELGEWVIDRALSQIIQWRSMGINLPVSVNISAYQVQQSNFTTRLATLLALHPEVAPNCLELEILETSALHDISQVSATMNACRELGVRFALDDFGTGYSSLTYLRRLPAHLIKIDQTFVREMLENADDSTIVEAVIGLAKAFRRDVIAEGVETIPHGLALLKIGCQLAQGYGIARPMPAIDIPKWVSNWKADDSWQI